MIECCSLALSRLPISIRSHPSSRRNMAIIFPSSVLNIAAVNPIRGTYASTRPITFSYVTGLTSSFSLASPLVVITPVIGLFVIIRCVIGVGPRDSSTNTITSPARIRAGSDGFEYTMLPTGIVGSMLPLTTT